MDTTSSGRHAVQESGTYADKGRYRVLLQEIRSPLDTPIGIALGQAGRVTDDNNTIESRDSDPHIR